MRTPMRPVPPMAPGRFLAMAGGNVQQLGRPVAGRRPRDRLQRHRGRHVRALPVVGEAPVPADIERTAFQVAGAAGTLELPRAAAGRRVPAVLALQNSLDLDGRSDAYAAQMLGAGIAVLDLAVADVAGIEAAVRALARPTDADPSTDRPKGPLTDSKLRTVRPGKARYDLPDYISPRPPLPLRPALRQCQVRTGRRSGQTLRMRFVPPRSPPRPRCVPYRPGRRASGGARRTTPVRSVHILPPRPFGAAPQRASTPRPGSLRREIRPRAPPRHPG